MFLPEWYDYHSGPNLSLDLRFFSVIGVLAGISTGQTWIYGGWPTPCITDAFLSIADSFPICLSLLQAKTHHR